MKTYLRHLLIALDQLVNAVLAGWPDETLSARAHRQGDWREKVIDALFFAAPDHCRRSFDAEVKRQQLPAAYRGPVWR